MIDDCSDNSVVQTASINDPFIPPRPPKLPKSATEAEKQERDALMRERKRCQDAVNHGKRTRDAVAVSNAKRAKGAERSKERIGAVAASNSESNAERAKGEERTEEKIGAVAASNSERAKGEERSQERIGAVADVNAKRAKSGMPTVIVIMQLQIRFVEAVQKMILGHGMARVERCVTTATYTRENSNTEVCLMAHSRFRITA